MASFPKLFSLAIKSPAAPARQAKRVALGRIRRSLAALVGLFGISAGAAEALAQEYPQAQRFPAAEYSLSDDFAPPSAPAQRAAPRKVSRLRWPGQDAPAAQEPILPVGYETFVGDDAENSSFVSDQPDGPVPPTPPTPPGRRNPLFRDPSDPAPEPGRPVPPGPDGLPLPGTGPDDLFVPEADEPFVLDPLDDQPLGLVGRRMYRPPMMQGMEDFYPIDDRWRLGFPQWNRYLRARPTSPWTASVIKGDYPIWGTGDKFMQFTAFSDTFFERRSVAAAKAAGGKADQTVFQETIFFTADFFRGDNSFHPSEWFLSMTPAFRYTDANFINGVNFWTLQQGFLDLQLAVVSDYYDTTNLRVGRQAFASDFRNFLFADTNDAVRLFGTDEGLRTFWNVLGFHMTQKDPVTQLNTFEQRDQQLLIGNVIRQDFIFSGFNALAGINYNHDTFRNKVDAFYLELAGNGRIGQYGVSAAFVQALGRDTLNPVTQVPVHVNAQLLALELTRPTDWFTPRASVLYASGDKTPGDGIGRGFDGIFDNPNFAGGGFSYLDRENVLIGGTRLSNAFSFYPNLRNKAFEPSNFVNPGLILGNVGFDAVLSTRWQMQLNANYYDFVHPESVAAKANVAAVGKHLGKEVSLGLLYRPLIVENVILTFGGAVFDPGAGISDLSGNEDMLWTTFGALTAVY